MAETGHARNARQAIDWPRIAASEEFRALTAAKRRFIIPGAIFFIIYYFALPALVGYWPDLMSTRVGGHINLAYLFALSQFVMAWVIMAMYVRRAQRYDRMVESLLASVKGRAS